MTVQHSGCGMIFLLILRQIYSDEIQQQTSYQKDWKNIQSGKKRNQLQVVSKDGVMVKSNVVEHR